MAFWNRKDSETFEKWASVFYMYIFGGGSGIMNHES